MRFSQQAQYAICGMFDLAYNGESLPVQVRVIGERQRIPARYLEHIFQRLRKAELVRGPGGGYVLARPAGDITLRHIVEAVEGPLTEGLAGGPPPRDRRPAHRPNFLWSELCERIEATLAEVSLEEVCRRAASEAVRRAGAESRVYHI
jgi:Rrf2 family iron-sulfur cluster assembly transcriptional regulator